MITERRITDDSTFLRGTRLLITNGTKCSTTSKRVLWFVSCTKHTKYADLKKPRDIRLHIIGPCVITLTYRHTLFPPPLPPEQRRRRKTIVNCSVRPSRITYSTGSTRSVESLKSIVFFNSSVTPSFNFFSFLFFFLYSIRRRKERNRLIDDEEKRSR